jgi:hypothetical protein
LAAGELACYSAAVEAAVEDLLPRLGVVAEEEEEEDQAW